MKKILFLKAAGTALFLGLLLSPALAQDTTASSGKKVYVREDLPEASQPVFPGGEKALEQHIRENLIYPKSALDSMIEGSVIVTFNINMHGDVEVTGILNGGSAMIIEGRGCETMTMEYRKKHKPIVKEMEIEALRVIDALPRWTPGTVDGQPVDVKCFVCVRFRLP